MRVERIPLSQIPHVTPLYSDYLSAHAKVSRYYPVPPLKRGWLAEQANARAKDYPLERRQRVADVLDAQNKDWGASRKTLDNITRLRDGDQAVVTGQQVGLFGGPLFAILKAITAVKVAEEATTAGVRAVPIFWLATEDHDVAEVSFANIPAKTHLQKVTILPDAIEGLPVSAVKLDDEIAVAARTASQLLGDSEVSQWIGEFYRPGTTLGDAYARLFARLFAKQGVILLDASSPELHEIAKPVYLKAAAQATEITDALLQRDQELEASGYHAQVKVTRTSTLLFASQDSVRTPVQRSNSHFAIGKEKFSAEDLAARVAARPQDFSANALLRPVVQDFLLPTLAYIGGPAEVAYFAQSAVVYEKLMGRITPILPRISATLLEPHIQRKLTRHQLLLPMVFQGEEILARTLATHGLPPELTAKFAGAKETLNTTLGSLEASLEKLDPTLKAAAERSGKKMKYQLSRLQQRAALAEQRRNADLIRHAHELTSALYPHKNLQEREVAGVYFIARYGMQLIDSLKDSTQSACPDHQVVYL